MTDLIWLIATDGLITIMKDVFVCLDIYELYVIMECIDIYEIYDVSELSGTYNVYESYGLCCIF